MYHGRVVWPNFMCRLLGTISGHPSGMDELSVVIISASTQHPHCKLAHLRPAGNHGLLAYLLTHVTTCGMAGDSAPQRRPREGHAAQMAAS
jgi:hypothetical protein